MSTTIPKLTLEDARALQSSFEGSITSSHDAQAEFRGKPTVLVPESIDDVERALRLGQAANRRVFVVSGHSISAADVSKSIAAARKAAAAIVSAEAFRARWPRSWSTRTSSSRSMTTRRRASCRPCSA